MTITEEYRLVRAAKNNDQDAQEALLNQFHNMLCGAADKYRARLGFHEMYQVAALNFLKCIRYFDTNRKPPLRLMTYSMPSVYRACADEHRRGNRVLSIPKYAETESLREHANRALSALSYNSEHFHGTGHLADQMFDRSLEPIEETVSRKLEIADLKKKIRKLSEKERYVIKRRLNGDFFDEIGDSLNTTRQWADQIDKRAKRKLREMYEAERQELSIS